MTAIEQLQMVLIVVACALVAAAILQLCRAIAAGFDAVRTRTHARDTEPWLLPDAPDLDDEVLVTFPEAWPEAPAESGEIDATPSVLGGVGGSG